VLVPWRRKGHEWTSDLATCGPVQDVLAQGILDKIDHYGSVDGGWRVDSCSARLVLSPEADCLMGNLCCQHKTRRRRHPELQSNLYYWGFIWMRGVWWILLGLGWRRISCSARLLEMILINTCTELNQSPDTRLQGNGFNWTRLPKDLHCLIVRQCLTRLATANRSSVNIRGRPCKDFPLM